MNKTEKIICLLLGAVLAWFIWAEMGRAKERARYAAEQAAIAATNVTVEAVAPQPSASKADAAANSETNAIAKPASVLPPTPEKIVVLENDEVKLELSTWGAVVKKVTLKKYAKDRGEISDENPPVVFDFSDSPLGAGAAAARFAAEQQRLYTIHGKENILDDPYYNPNLTRDREDFSESDDLRRLKEGRVTVRFRGGTLQ